MTVGFLGGKFLPFHQGHVYMILDASNRVDELNVILSSSKNRDRELCSRDGIKYMPADVRLSWLGKNLNNIDNVNIIHIEDDHWDDDYDWEEGATMIKRVIGKPIDYVFSSEPEYGDIFAQYYPGTQHVVVDAGRDTVNISATSLRKNLYDNWDKLPGSVRSFFTKKVALVGTESVGKSTLTQKLAKFYNTNFVAETGREVCEDFGNQLTVPMFDSIAMEHYLRQEKAAEESNKLLFVDSDAVITQYYLDMYFGERSSLIEEISRKQDYDLLLYLRPDIPWVDDGLRFASENRLENDKRLQSMYDQKLTLVAGDYAERFSQARKHIDDLFE